VLFIGSTIGNFEPSEASAVCAISGNLWTPGDALLMGIDLVKDARVYCMRLQGPQLVTERVTTKRFFFCRRINRKLVRRTLDVRLFKSIALWKRADSSIGKCIWRAAFEQTVKRARPEQELPL